jgi:hypothetical protein
MLLHCIAWRHRIQLAFCLHLFLYRFCIGKHFWFMHDERKKKEERRKKKEERRKRGRKETKKQRPVGYRRARVRGEMEMAWAQ